MHNYLGQRSTNSFALLKSEEIKAEKGGKKGKVTKNRSVPRRTPREQISSLDDEDRNPPINNSLREDRNASINTNQGAIYTATQSVDTIA